MASFPFHIYFEIAALLCAVIFFKSLRKSGFDLFAPYLAFIVLVEVLGWYLPVYLKQHTGWVFNISVPVEYLFFSFIFHQHYQKKINKRIVIVFIVFFAGYMLYYSLFKNIKYFNAYYLLIGSFVMILMSIAYFFEQFYKNETGNIWNEPMFWITAGVLLFNIGEFSYDLVSNFIIKNLFDPINVLFREVNNKLIILLYLLISIGLIICRKKSKQSRKVSASM